MLDKLLVRLLMRHTPEGMYWTRRADIFYTLWARVSRG